MTTALAGMAQTTKTAGKGQTGGGSAAGADGTSKDAGQQFMDLLSNMSGRSQVGGEENSATAAKKQGKGEGESGNAGEQNQKGDAAAENGKDTTTEGSATAKASGATSFGVETLSGALNLVSKVVEGGRGNASAEGAVFKQGAGLQKLQSYLSSGLALSKGAAAQQGGNSAASAALTMNSGGGKQGTSSLFAEFGTEPQRLGDSLLKDAKKAEALSKIEPGTLKVLKQETHFAPSMRLSPIQQVGQSIVGALNELADSFRTGTSPLAKPEGPVLKTLEIQLTPHELGTVKVTVKMVDNAVEVTLRASNPATAELLKQDRVLLDQMLRATGHKAETITIQAAGDDRPVFASQASSNTGQSQSGTNQGAGDQDNSQGFQQSDPQSGQNRGGQDRQFGVEEGLVPEDRVRSEHEESASDNRDGGIYL